MVERLLGGAGARAVDKEIASDPAVYPPAALRARLYLPAERGPEYDRLRTRVWTHIKTGQ
jgi:putrescine transport system substrate-binding protein